MDVFAIARQAWKRLWANKYLWFFGFFVAGMSGSGAGNPRYAGSASNGGTGAVRWSWPLVTCAAGIGMAALAMHVVSEAALIEGVGRRGGEAPGVRAGMATGLRHFWRVLSVKLFAVLVAVVATAFIAAPGLLAVLKALPFWLGIPLTVTLAVVGAPLLLTVYFLYEYALRFAVLEGAPATDAFRAAGAFLHGRLVPSLLLLVASQASVVVACAAGLVAAVPGAVVGLAVYFAVGLVPGFVAGAALLVPMVFAVFGALGTFRSAVWTLGFLDAQRAA